MLSQQEIDTFNEQGFLALRDAIHPAELEAVRAAADEVIEDRESRFQHDLKYGGLVGAGVGQGDVLCRVEYTLDKHPTFLRLAANPRVLEVATSLHPATPLVLTWEDMIVKMPGAPFGVEWHQDLLHQSTKSLVFSVGIYLDDSTSDPLHFLPGTQTLGPVSDRERDDLVANASETVVTVPARAGDILVHNVLCVHSSPPNSGSSPRRVVYFEFRTTDQVKSDSPWGDDWLERRRALLPAAIQARRGSDVARHYPEELIDEVESKVLSWPAANGHAVDLRVRHDDLGS
jgi:ectoine hydroxylase-related dioxygenase (phytanoyl-CoA dioxygenase family)